MNIFQDNLVFQTMYKLYIDGNFLYSSFPYRMDGKMEIFKIDTNESTCKVIEILATSPDHTVPFIYKERSTNQKFLSPHNL